MHAQIVVVYYSSYWHRLERFEEELVDVFFLVFVEYFVPEGEMLSHCPCLVVSS